MKQASEELLEASPAFGGATERITPEDLLPLPQENEPPEVRAARSLAGRYRLPYVDLLPPDGESPIDYAVLAELPVDLMVRHQFVPLRREGRRLHVAMADPLSLIHISEPTRPY